MAPFPGVGPTGGVANPPLLPPHADRHANASRPAIVFRCDITFCFPYLLALEGFYSPLVLARLIGRLQNLNVLPRRVVAEFGPGNTLHIEVDILGASGPRLSLPAAKLREDVCVLNAYWHAL